MKMSKIIVVLLLLFVGAVFYFSWLPDHNFESETYLPKWLLDWSSTHYNLRTAVPFVAVGFLLEAYMRHISSSKLYHHRYSSFLKNLGISTVIVCIAEGGQFLIQKRNPDLMDVYFGILGSMMGWLGYQLFAVIMNFKKLRNAK